MTPPTRLHLAPVIRQLRARQQVQSRTVDPTERETLVLLGISYGHTNRAIATALKVSEDTVKSYVRRLFRKFEVNDRAHLVRVGFERGVLIAQAPGYSHFAVRGPKGWGGVDGD